MVSSSCYANVGFTWLFFFWNVVSQRTGTFVAAEVWNFLDDFGGIPDDDSFDACQYNTKTLSAALQYNASGNTILMNANRTFHFHHGIYAANVTNFTFIVDGTLRFKRIEHEHDDSWFPAPCFMLDTSTNITITSHTQRGLFDGRGSEYWGIPVIGYLEIVERRPRLIQFNQTSHLLIENIILQDSPYHTLLLNGVNHTTVRNVSIVARRTYHDGHDWLDLSAFNTDGIDVSGNNIHIHDVDIWNQDDCIAVKDNVFEPYESTNMVFEHINCSGVGLVVGSISGSRVYNITFRNSYLYKAVKGIYLKFHPTTEYWIDLNRTGSISNVTFSNITMEQPTQWPIWMGPAQQSDSKRPCHANPCSICWPMTPRSVCNPVSNTVFTNITLRHVQINNPYFSPGVLLGDESDNASMVNILFDHVRVTKGPPVPAAQQDRLLSFPGLAQPINDQYVPNHWKHASSGRNNNLRSKQHYSIFQIFDRWGIHHLEYFTNHHHLHDFKGRLLRFYWDWLSVAVSVAAHAGAPIIVLGTMRMIRKYQTCNHQVNMKKTWKVAMAILLYFVIFVNVSVPWRKPEWNRTNQYFRCNGVQKGVATGNTWPVPSCFTSTTTNDLSLVERIRLEISASMDSIEPISGMISLLILFAATFGVYYYAECQNRTNRHKIEKKQSPSSEELDSCLQDSLLVKDHPRHNKQQPGDADKQPLLF